MIQSIGLNSNILYGIEGESRLQKITAIVLGILVLLSAGSLIFPLPDTLRWMSYGLIGGLFTGFVALVIQVVSCPKNEKVTAIPIQPAEGKWIYDVPQTMPKLINLETNGEPDYKLFIKKSLSMGNHPSSAYFIVVNDGEEGHKYRVDLTKFAPYKILVPQSETITLINKNFGEWYQAHSIDVEFLGEMSECTAVALFDKPKRTLIIKFLMLRGEAMLEAERKMAASPSIMEFLKSYPFFGDFVAERS